MGSEGQTSSSVLFGSGACFPQGDLRKAGLPLTALFQ